MSSNVQLKKDPISEILLTYNQLYNVAAPAPFPTTKALESTRIRIRTSSASTSQAKAAEEKTLRTYLTWMLIAEYAVIIAQALVYGYTDPLNTDSNVVLFLMFSLQLFLLMAIVLGFFLLTSRTVYIQLGIYNKYLIEFKWFYITFLIAAGFFGGVQGYKLVLASQNTPQMAIWKAPVYYPIWVVQRVVLLGFDCIAAYYSMRVLQDKYYDPEALFLGGQSGM